MKQSSYERPLPASISAEQAVLGSIMLDRDAISVIVDSLRPMHFYLEKHAWIYEAALSCFRRREPPDMPNVAEELRRQERLDLVGGISLLADLLTETPTAVHVEYYAGHVLSTWNSRNLIETGGRIAALGYDEAEPVEDRIDQAEQLLFSVSEELRDEFCSAEDAVNDYYQALREAEASDTPLSTPTGYHDLDDLTGGLRSGEIIIVGARPGVGKTSLLLSLLLNLARSGVGVGIFSLEMDRRLLIQRLTSMICGIPADAISSELLSGNELVIQAMGEVSKLPFWIDHSETANVHTIRSRARKLSLRKPVSVWMVDYLQLAATGGEKDEMQRVSAVSNGLRSLARELRQPIIVASQLSRGLENRTIKVPTLSDLRWSGDIEQDASQVWFLYRDEMYNDQTDKKGITEIHVAKNRNGATGVVPVRFDARTTRFQNLERYRAPAGYAAD